MNFNNKSLKIMNTEYILIYNSSRKERLIYEKKQRK